MFFSQLVGRVRECAMIAGAEWQHEAREKLADLYSKVLDWDDEPGDDHKTKALDHAEPIKAKRRRSQKKVLAKGDK